MVRKMESEAEGSNLFLRGFKNPSFHFVALFLLQNVWAKPYFYEVNKNFYITF